jgi:serine protease SohB
MDKIFDFLLFLAEIITITIAILTILGFAMSKAAEGKEKGKITIRSLNDHYRHLKRHMQKSVLTKKDYKTLKDKKKKKDKSENDKTRLFVLNFKGDVRASDVSALREEITAILLIAKPNDEVCLRLESPGGMVPHYGLATSQLQRLKDKGIKLTICVDKVAASGGYMMAVVADRIIAAPFAIIGSIGVVAQLPNFNRFLDKNAIDFEQITAGEYKRTLTVFGENTQEGREKVQEDINLTHDLFKQHIIEHRQQLDLEKVATGEHWYATQAIAFELIDDIQTSDDYLMSLLQTHQLLTVSYKTKVPKLKQLTQQASQLVTGQLSQQALLKKMGL